MSSKKRVLLKITGEVIPHHNGAFDISKLMDLALQIKALQNTIQFGIVIGGGNLFRGNTSRVVSPRLGHYIGMTATAMNGLLIHDILEQAGVKTTLLCALECPQLGSPITPFSIKIAEEANSCIIFSGGTGNPYVTTDTTAIIRGLQINAQEIWKGTKVAGIYDLDPKKYAHATFLPNVSYKYVLEHKLAIMDFSACSLAEQHNLKTRVFDIFTPDALLIAAQDPHFGSTIQMENL